MIHYIFSSQYNPVERDSVHEFIDSHRASRAKVERCLVQRPYSGLIELSSDGILCLI